MPRRARITDATGQATVELALAMPLVVMLVLVVLQVSLVARDQLALELAAREAARAASVSADPAGAAAAAARQVTHLDPVSVSVEVGAGTVRVELRYRNGTDVPIIGHTMGDVDLVASAVMALEPPG